jgi:hypothetical protein
MNTNNWSYSCITVACTGGIIKLIEDSGFKQNTITVTIIIGTRNEPASLPVISSMKISDFLKSTSSPQADEISAKDHLLI